MLRSFVETEVDPQALQFNREEKFNYDLFKKLGDLGILGVTVSWGMSAPQLIVSISLHSQ